jgi:hypothetical protein
MRVFTDLEAECAESGLNPDGTVLIELNLRLLAFSVMKLFLQVLKLDDNLKDWDYASNPMINSLNDLEYDQLIGSFRS